MKPPASRRRRGIAAVEYGLVITLTMVIVIGAVSTVSTLMNAMFSNVSSAMNGNNN